MSLSKKGRKRKRTIDVSAASLSGGRTSWSGKKGFYEQEREEKKTLGSSETRGEKKSSHRNKRKHAQTSLLGKGKGIS